MAQDDELADTLFVMKVKQLLGYHDYIGITPAYRLSCNGDAMSFRERFH